MAEEKKSGKKNPMEEILLEKVILSVGGTGDYLQKGVKLLKTLTNRKPLVTKSKKRIPTLGVRPGLEIGAVVTIRKNKEGVLKKMLEAEDNKIRKKQVSQNNFSFGVKEYIEIPGVEYDREIGIMGFDVTLVFKRKGKRVKLRKIKKGKLPQKNHISKEEIIAFMENKFNTNFE